MDVKELSSEYDVRILREEDADDIFALCSQNELFYEFHPPFVTKESILEDMKALPPGKERKDKFYVGFLKDGQLAAVMDLILDYPEERTVYIGFFMVNRKFQGRGNGSSIVDECAECFRKLGYGKIRLAIDRGNPQSEAFWTKNRFEKTGEEIPNDFSAYFSMEKII